MTTGNRWMALGLVALMATAPAAARQTNNRIERLATDLELSEAQKTAITGSVQPGERNLWTLATSLQQNLNSEQKDKFLAQGERMIAFGQGVQAGRSQAAAGQARGQREVARQGQRRTMRPDSAVTGQRSVTRRQGVGRAAQVRSREPVVDRMIDSLTDHQKAELQVLRKANAEKMKALRGSVQAGDVDRADARRQMGEVQKAMREDADAVLTDEQKARMKEMQTRQRQRARTTSRRTRGSTVGSRQAAGVRTLARGHSPKAAAEMATALGLSEAQVELIKIHATLTAAGTMQRAGIAQNGGRASRNGRSKGTRGRRSNRDR
ncbi:MAG: hypothetical protein ACI9W4_002162 [Rhodothermales bacterium]|jgi:hypothetical protein